MRKKLISFIAFLFLSSSLFAQVKGGHSGADSGGPRKYEAASEAERAFVEAFNLCIDSKVKYTNFREIYLSLSLTDFSSQLNKIETNQTTPNCSNSSCISSPKVKEPLRIFLSAQGIDEYLIIYHGLDPADVKKDVKKWLAP